MGPSPGESCPGMLLDEQVLESKTFKTQSGESESKFTKAQGKQNGLLAKMEA